MEGWAGSRQLANSWRILDPISGYLKPRQRLAVKPFACCWPKAFSAREVGCRRTATSFPVRKWPDTKNEASMLLGAAAILQKRACSPTTTPLPQTTTLFSRFLPILGGSPEDWMQQPGAVHSDKLSPAQDCGEPPVGHSQRLTNRSMLPPICINKYVVSIVQSLLHFL